MCSAIHLARYVCEKKRGGGGGGGGGGVGMGGGGLGLKFGNQCLPLYVDFFYSPNLCVSYQNQGLENIISII